MFSIQLCNIEVNAQFGFRRENTKEHEAAGQESLLQEGQLDIVQLDLNAGSDFEQDQNEIAGTKPKFKIPRISKSRLASVIVEAPEAERVVLPQRGRSKFSYWNKNGSDRHNSTLFERNRSDDRNHRGFDFSHGGPNYRRKVFIKPRSSNRSRSPVRSRTPVHSRSSPVARSNSPIRARNPFKRLGPLPAVSNISSSSDSTSETQVVQPLQPQLQFSQPFPVWQASSFGGQSGFFVPFACLPAAQIACASTPQSIGSVLPQLQPQPPTVAVVENAKKKKSRPDKRTRALLRQIAEAKK